MSFSPLTLLLVLAVIVGGGLGVRYTLQVDETSREFHNLETQVAGIEQVVRTKRQVVESGEKIAAEMAELDTRHAELDAQLREHEIALRELETTYKYLCETLPSAVTKVREQAVGEEFPQLATTKGQVFKNAKIKEVTHEEISIFHESGSSRVPRAELPPELIERFRLGQSYPSMSDVSSLVDFKRSSPTSGSRPKSTSRDAQKASPDSGKTSATNTESFNADWVVFIETNAGRGSGFIAVENGVAFVYTNAHVICGNPGMFATQIKSVVTASGRTLGVPYEIQLSESYDPDAPNGLEDVARFKVNLPEGMTGYELNGASEPLKMNMPIVAYGNSEGAGVMTSLEGSLLGLGTDRLEISCDIVPGNSGGPVVAKDTNRVIGISTYADTGDRDIWSSGTRFGSVRRFAVRPEKVKKWRAMRYTALQSALTQLADFDRDTLSLAAACFLNPRGNIGGFEAPSTQRGDFVIREVITDGSRNRLGKVIAGGIAEVNQRLGSTPGTYSLQAAVPVYQNFFGTVTQASESQTRELSQADRVPYLKQFVGNLVKVRMIVHNEFMNQGATRFR